MRFPGFEGEWKTDKLGNLVTNKSKKFNPGNSGSQIKCIELEHISANDGKLLGHVDGSKSGSIKNVFYKGNVLFGKLRPYLRKYLLVNFDGVCSSEIWVMTGNRISSPFLYQLVQTNKFIAAANQSTGSKMPRADWKVVENTIFSYPSENEQEKISNFLTLLNERIQTQSKIIRDLKSLKAGLSDALFSNQPRTGYMRNNWEKYIVTELLEFFPTNSLSWEKLELKKSGISNLHYGLIHKHQFQHLDIKNHTLPKIKTTTVGYNEFFCKDGDIAFADASEDLNDIGKAVELINCGGDRIVCGLHTLHGRDRLGVTIPGFKGYCFSSKYFKYQLKRLAQGTKVFSIGVKTFKDCIVEIPPKQEQAKIYGLLSVLDKKIKIEVDLFDQFKVQKAFMLDRLFI